MENARRSPPFELIAGRACLDFTNTLGGKRGAASTEKLTDYGALLRFATQAKLVSRGEAARLNGEAARHPRRAEQALSEAVALREALHALFRAAAHGGEAPAEALALVNAALAAAQGGRRLIRASSGFELAFSARPEDLAPFLQPLLVEAAGLLCAPEVALVRVCAEELEDRCDWLFLDESRGGTRRFCSMSDCGNRAKQRRHYRRLQARRPDAS